MRRRRVDVDFHLKIHFRDRSCREKALSSCYDRDPMDFKDFKSLFFYNFDDLHGAGGVPGCVDAESMSIFT